MLKGHVFKKQTFRSEVFAFWIDTLLDKKCGIGNYKNKMNVTYSGRNLTIANGLACIRGRFVEEDTSTTVPTGTDNAYCKLVIEIDLDKENTETELNQVSYKIVKGTNSYPSLTQNNIVANNNGKYQYELARFRTTVNGITDFTDRRTYLDFNCIFTEIQTEYREVLNELKEELKIAKDGSLYVLNEVESTSVAGMDSDGSFYIEFTRFGKLVVVNASMVYAFDNRTNIPFTVPSFAKIDKAYNYNKTICSCTAYDSDARKAIGKLEIIKYENGETRGRYSIRNLGEEKNIEVHLTTTYILE